MSFRVLVVDDEPLARERLRRFLDTDPRIEVLAECGTGIEAVDAIERDRPDLVFLDIQMPDLDGFGVLRRVGVERMPTFIVVTAFDSYTAEALETHAVDLLRKPFDRDRFRSVLEQALEQCDQRRLCRPGEPRSAQLQR